MPMNSQIVTLTPADHTAMQAYVAAPRVPATKAVLVLQEAFGVNAYVRGVCDQLAALGYLALAPELYHRTAPAGYTAPYDDFPSLMPHLKAVTQPGLEADLQACYVWLTGASEHPISGVAALGFCLGGRAAFIANGLLPLAAAISCYGGGIAPDLLPLAAKQHGPLALIWGGQDKHIPKEQRDAVVEAMVAAQKPYLEVVFAEADHGFFCHDRPAYHATSAVEGWALIETFLHTEFYGSEEADPDSRPVSAAEGPRDSASL